MKNNCIEKDKNVNINELINKTLLQIIFTNNQRKIVFYCSDGTIYSMYHERDCCEIVYIEDIIGDTKNLINSPILMAEKITNSGYKNKKETRYTWTFYKFATIKDYVTIRWYGYSNGYYSEEVSFKQITKLILRSCF